MPAGKRCAGSIGCNKLFVWTLCVRMEDTMSALSYPTPHIAAAPSDFAETVLMPGDPLRSRFIAENFLKDARMVNNVRGVQGYTGTYQGCPVSVMASGMGMPSIGIYSYELYQVFGVENIIRIGSAGAIREDISVRDLVFGMGAATDSAFGGQYCLPGTFAPIADFGLLSAAVAEAEKRGARFHIGELLSSDCFYCDDKSANAAWAKMGVMAIEMEAAGLYLTAARCRKRALAICTVSDQLLTGDAMTAGERETSLVQMIEIALQTACALHRER